MTNRREYITKSALNAAGMVMSSIGFRTVSAAGIAGFIPNSPKSCSPGKKSFLNQNRPVITALLNAETPEEFIVKAAKSESEGAGGIAIELKSLKPEFRSRNSLKSI